jgi:hypothetical protein
MGESYHEKGQKEAERVLRQMSPWALIGHDDRSRAQHAMDLAERIAEIRGESYVVVYQKEKDDLRDILGFRVFAERPRIRKGHADSIGSFVMHADGGDKRLFQLDDLVAKEYGPMSYMEEGVRGFVSVYRLKHEGGKEDGS